MGYILARCAAILALSSALLPAAAQTAGSSAKALPRTMPDMVCWGSGPKWSVEFASWGARYLGVNTPDRDFSGGFNWVPTDKTWVWQQQTLDLAPKGRPNLSAVIKGSACTDPVDKKIYPYSAQVKLPQGDEVTGCCRRLKPGEAPIGPHGVPPNETPK
jgi:uncharacterized membrane protein